MKPLFLLGAGARESASEIVAFAEKYGIPMETTWNAVDLVPYDHPLFVGRPGITATRGSNLCIQNCDTLIALGARLDPLTIAYKYDKFAPNAYKELVDIDIAEGLKFPVHIGFKHMDCGEYIRRLQPLESSAEWLTQCQEWKKTRLEGTTPTYELMSLLSDTLPDDAILVVGCSSIAVNVFCAGFRNKKGQRYIMSSCGLGTMGAGLPVAVGVAIASGKRVTLVESDGSLMQNVQELETIHRLNLPIDIYILNNGGYASIYSSEMRAFGRTARLESIPDLNKVASAFGVPIHVIKTPIDEPLKPRVMFDGRGCLEDMWPY